MTDFDQDDIAAMRQENGGADLKRFMRDQLRAGLQRRDTPTVAAPPPRPPGHRPGTWPSGTSPPEPRPSAHTPAQWGAALNEYRAALMADDHTQLNSDQPCGCVTCQLAKEN
ncbi:hypothetical protein [Streptomyces sp. 4R-3d]|uniref:hypothetical protein n=1 Tax=Streptomyces sp. 4R-3d TaxID=2559605 RepID=UPI001072A038|nr:hypothetical protein [Streptomyces sp. 4R-3d]TFI30110.1 hypothetical protein E4P36_05000 [Streptomyces sp. 4R-3d]